MTLIFSILTFVAGIAASTVLCISACKEAKRKVDDKCDPDAREEQLSRLFITLAIGFIAITCVTMACLTIQGIHAGRPSPDSTESPTVSVTPNQKEENRQEQQPHISTEPMPRE